jgi:DNA-binding CsgD family transcriptional regulator
LLDGMGLTQGEEAVYVELMDLPAAGLAELRARCAAIEVAPALAGLERKGLVVRLPGTSLRYAAAPPDMALEALARAREQELAGARLAIAQLTSRYRLAQVATRPHEVVEVVTTRQATLLRWEQLQRSARREVRSFDRPPYVNASENPLEIELLETGIAYRCVYQAAGFALPGRPEAVRAMMAAGEQVRVTESVPVKMFIADDQLGLLPLEMAGSAESCLIIHASSLLDTLIALFEHVWDRAVAIHGDGELPVLDAGPSQAEAELLPLLAAGLTDEAIARHLGTHPRTVQRRVRGLLDKLGAATRFQAGLQAARRGWL